MQGLVLQQIQMIIPDCYKNQKRLNARSYPSSNRFRFIYIFLPSVSHLQTPGF